MYNQKEFKDWMRTNTTLLEGSISVYARVIQTYFNEYGKLSMTDIKKFVSSHNREANSVHVRAPFLHYFKFRGVDPKHYKTLPKVREMPKKRRGVYLRSDLVMKLIKSIDNKAHKDLSIVRFYTGIRAFEALTIKSENIRKKIFIFKKNGQKQKEKVIEISIISKGNKEKKVYMKYNIAKKVFKPYLKGGAGFIFIPKQLGGIERDNKELFWQKLQNQMRYYYTSFQKAAKAIGLNKHYGTHDLRRFFAEWASNNYDLPVVQKMMGHVRIDTTLRYLPDKSNEAVAAMLRL